MPKNHTMFGLVFLLDVFLASYMPKSLDSSFNLEKSENNTSYTYIFMTDEGPSESWRQFKYHRNMSTKLRSFGKLESADLQWRKAVESVEGIFYKKRTIFSQEFSAVCDDYKFIKMSPFAICKTKTAIDPNKMPHHFEWKIVDKFTEHEGSYKSSSYPSEHSIQYQDLDPNFSLNFTPFNGIDGDGLRLGFVEIIDAQFFNYSKDCLNDSWVLYPVKEYHRYFDYIYDSNPSPYFKVSYSNPPVVPLNNEFSIHATQTTGVTISYDDSNGDYRILPSASFFIDNGLPKIGSPFCSKNDLDYKEGATFEYFAENNVRLVNRSLKFPSNAQISRIYDWFARRYDQLHTVASGNAANQTTWCNSHNAICVGGYLDEDDGNVNTSNDKLDDTHYDSYSSVNVSNSDREEPDVVEVPVTLRSGREVYYHWRAIVELNEDTGAYHYYLTNAPEDLISCEDARDLYALRWQIDTIKRSPRSWSRE